MNMTKKIIGPISLVTLLLSVLILILLSQKPKTEEPLKGPSPTITLVPTITPQPTDLFITSVLPVQNPEAPYLPIQKITFIFSEFVQPGELKYEISPKTEVLIRGGLNDQTLYIIPRNKWELGETTVTILQSTRSISGKSLYQPYVYRLLIDIPPPPVVLEGDHP